MHSRQCSRNQREFFGDHVSNKANQCSKEPNVIGEFFVAEQNVNTGGGGGLKDADLYLYSVKAIRMRWKYPESSVTKPYFSIDAMSF